MQPVPKITICLPSLNTRRYLSDRFETIYNQTFQDWEVVAVDSYSEDGSWDFLQEQARQDPRVRISQAPRGLYASWNRCILQARGQYIYFATSDDTMVPTCLEKMLVALEEHPTCGLCQCSLEMIDDHGHPLPGEGWSGFPFPRFAQDWLDRAHIRPAPLDGILHFALLTVYTSITQLLIRRRVFDKIGLFDVTWGTLGDFEWGTRVGLTEDCIFIPEKLATWRVHSQQASHATDIAAIRRQMLAMVRVAHARTCALAEHQFGRRVLSRLSEFYRQQVVVFGIGRAETRFRRIAFLAREILRGNVEALRYGVVRDSRDRFYETAQFNALRELLKQLNVPEPQFLS